MAREYKLQRKKPVSASGDRLRKGAEPGTVPRSHLAAGKGPGHRRSGIRENPHAHLPCLLATGSGGKRPQHPPSHFHQQVRAGNGRARPLPRPGRCLRSLGRDFPLHLQPHPAPPRGGDRLHEILFHPGSRRPEIPDERSRRHVRYRYEAAPLPKIRRPHFHVQPDGQHRSDP